MSVVATERPISVDVRALDSALERSRTRAEERHLPVMRDAYEKLIRRAARDAAASLTAQTITAASDWQPPPEGTMFNADEQAAAARAALARSHRRVVAAVAGPPLDRAGIAWDITHPLVQELLENAGQRTGEALGEAVQFELRLALATAYTEGLAVKDAATLIRQKIEDAAPWQAEMLARTDLNGLSNGSSLMTAKLVGVQTKIWLTAADERVRPEHMAVNGQEVPIDQPFQVCGESLAYPGDPFGSDGCVANCRCTVVYGQKSAKAAMTQPTQPLNLEPDEAFASKIEQKFQDGWGKVGAREHGMTVDEYGAALLAAVREKVVASTIRVRTPIDVADRVLEEGRFVSQFESGTSRGILNNDLRADAEEILYGYTDLPAAERPIYGYLSVSEGETSLGSYGEVSWTLRPQMRTRTTFTADDSLGMRTIPSPVDDPRVLSVPAPRYSTTPDPLDTARITDNAEFVDKWNAYWEAQIHGGVSVDDVASVDLWEAYQPIYDYPGAPPPQLHEWAARLRDQLEARGIEVRLHEKTAYEEVRE